MDESKPRDKQEINPDLDSNPQRILPTAADDGDPLFNIRGLVDHWIDRFQKVVIEDKSDIIYRSMIPTLDLMTRGIRPGELWLVAGHSRYCFPLWMVEQLCLNQQVPTLAYTYDMSVFEMVDRLVLSRSKYSRTRLNRGLVPTKDDLRSIQQAAKELREAALTVQDMMGLTVDGIVAKARQVKETGTLGYLVVDNYQKLVNETWDVERIFKTLKKLAIELEIPILIVSKPATCPDCDDEDSMSDIADRKVIEKYVELIGSIEYSGSYSKEGKTHLLLHISSNRSGVKGCVELWFDGTLHRLEPVDMRIELAEVEHMFL